MPDRPPASGNDHAEGGRPLGHDGGDRDHLAISDRWRAWRARVDLDEYATRWDRMAAAGESVHGEADLVEAVGPSRPGRVLDAGCGVGRVAAELARRGWDTVGVDNDPDMVDRARTRHPELTWILADLATVEASTPAAGVGFDVVVVAGNVLGFVVPGREPAVVANLAHHLVTGGALVAGMGTGDYPLDRYDDACRAAGLVLAARYRSWDREPFDDGRYAVSVHRRPLPPTGDVAAPHR